MKGFHWRYQIRKNLVGNIKDEIIWEILSYNLHAHRSGYWQTKKGRPTKLSDRQKRNILRQTKVLQEEMGNFSVKRVTVRAGILPSVSTATVRRVMKKTELKLSHAQKKGEQAKSDLNLRFMFSWKVRRKLSKGFWTGDVEFYLDVTIFTTKWILLINPGLQELWCG